ncbi:hypothetical protein V1280_007511 [Bradyrhizobium sp. AZCC 2230]
MLFLPALEGRAIAYGFYEDCAGLLRLSRLRERPTRSQSVAGEGSRNAGTFSAIRDNPDAETPPPQPSPASGRGSTSADAAASCTPYAIALPWRGRVGT